MTPLSALLAAWTDQAASALAAAGWSPDEAAERAAALFPAPTAPAPIPQEDPS